MKTHQFKLILILTLMCPRLLWGNTPERNELILIQSQNVTHPEFQAYILSQDQVKEYSQWAFENYLSPQLIFKWEQQLSVILENHNQMSDDLFIKSCHQALSPLQEYNWPVKTRNKAVQLGLICYQREKSEERKVQLMHQLVDFFPEYQPIKSLTPNPITQEWTSELTNKPQIAWTPQGDWEDFQILIINGRVIHLNHKETLTIPDRMVRITAFSNLYHSIDRIIMGSMLVQFHPPQEFLATGECSLPHLHPFIDRQPSSISLGIYFPQGCIYQKRDSTKLSSQIEKKSHLTSYESFYSHFLKSDQIPFTESIKENKKHPYWILWFMAALTTGLMIQSLNQPQAKDTTSNLKNHPDSKPIHHQGF